MKALVDAALRERRRSLLVWSLAVGLTGAFFMLIWPSVEEAIGGAVEAYPENLKEAFGIGSLTTPEEYLNAELFSVILPLALGVFALRSVSASIAGAEERGHLDVLLSAPISRSQLVAATLIAIAAELAIVLVAGWTLTCLGSVVAGAGLSAGQAGAAFAGLWPLAMFIAGVATLVTGWSGRAAIVSGVAGGTLVAMYLLDLIGRLDDAIEGVRWISVFRYNAHAAVEGIDPVAFAGVTVAAAGLAVAGALLLERRDI